MPTSYKVLGQSSPTAVQHTAVYTVPASTEAVISTITVCNRSSSPTTFRIAVRPNGATLANQHYLAFDSVIGSNDTIALTLGITLDAADVIAVYTPSSDLSFSIFGSEVT